MIQELYDIVVLPGMRRPSALGFRTDEARRVLSVAGSDVGCGTQIGPMAQQERRLLCPSP